MSNGIRAFIYFVRHLQAPLSPLLAPSFLLGCWAAHLLEDDKSTLIWRRKASLVVSAIETWVAFQPRVTGLCCSLRNSKVYFPPTSPSFPKKSISLVKPINVNAISVQGNTKMRTKDVQEECFKIDRLFWWNNGEEIKSKEQNGSSCRDNREVRAKNNEHQCYCVYRHVHHRGRCDNSPEKTKQLLQANSWATMLSGITCLLITEQNHDLKLEQRWGVHSQHSRHSD